jgi:hypothetical protein
LNKIDGNEKGRKCEKSRHGILCVLEFLNAK